jgi:hypothetical protein
MHVTELEAIEGELERLHDRCERGILLSSEISLLLVALDARARAALPAGSDLFRLLDSRLKAGSDHWEMTINGYVTPRDCRNIGRRIAALRRVLKEIEPEFLRTEQAPKTQLYFASGEVYRARQEFYRMLKRGATRVDIADPHLDPDTFDFVDALDIGVAARLLTGAPKSLFVQQLHALQTMRRSVEARSNDRNHDRFVILDGSEVWHLGASINGLGRKAFMMNRVVNEDERAKIVAEFEDWWNAGTVI